MSHIVSDGFFARRWQGKVPLRLLLWRDMLGVGSLVNIACSVLALVMASRGAALGIAVAVYFAPLPYNAFLFASVLNSPQRNAIACTVAAFWLIVMTLA
jgi:hypothetical protein